MEFPTFDVIGAKQNTCICYFFLLGRHERCSFVVCDDILFVARDLGLGRLIDQKARSRGRIGCAR
jgi:hypothetical protein